MYTEKKLLLTSNWKEIQQAEKLGLDAPEPITRKADMLFWKSDLKKVILDPADGSILIEFADGATHELEFDKKIWDELKVYFKENDK